MDTVRLFAAISLTESLRDELNRVQQRLKSEMPDGCVRWVRPAAIHLTLKFLGETSAHNVPRIEEALAAIARHVPTCRILVKGLGCFPNTRRPRVVWVGLEEPTGTLAVLQRAVEEAMAVLGYPAEGRAFTPHLTLGRVDRRASSGEVRRIGEAIATTALDTIGQIEVEHLDLIRSVLRPSGAEYTTLMSFPVWTA